MQIPISILQMSPAQNFPPVINNISRCNSTYQAISKVSQETIKIIKLTQQQIEQSFTNQKVENTFLYLY